MKAKGLRACLSHLTLSLGFIVALHAISPPVAGAQAGGSTVSTNSRLLEIWRLYWGEEKEAAILLARQTVARDPQNPDAVFFDGIARAIGNPKFNADRFAEEFVSCLRTKADLARFVGMLYLWLLADEEAAEYFNKAIWQDATDASSHTLLGLVYYRMARIKEGAVQYDSPERLQQARRSLETAIRLEPNNAMACYYLGNVFCKLDDAGAARRTYEQALAIEPDNWHARANLASLLLRMKHKDQALAQIDYLERTVPARQALWATYRQAFDADLEMFRF